MICMRSNHRLTVGFAVSMLLVLFVLLSGCAKPPFSAKLETPPPVKYCNAAIGHITGTKPFIIGGTCCCTPTQALVDQYHKDGFLLDMSLNDLLKLYADKGIKTDYDHKHCNNMCPNGPHIVFGGHCMATPTMGTPNFEAVVTGVHLLLYKDIYKAKDEAGAIGF